MNSALEKELEKALQSEQGPKYQRLKSYILKQIGNNIWPPSFLLPTELEFSRTLSMSRMTVNRALRELANEGILVRTAGAGTYVAEPKSSGHLLEIHNIADEVRQRNHDYSCQLIVNKLDKLNSKDAARMQLATGTKVFHTVIVHLENNRPIQIEDRYVNPEVVPDYGTTDFTVTTPAEFLLKVAPLQEAEHRVQARMPTAEHKKLLKLKSSEPCLVLLRRTWSLSKIASVATMYHPGDSYELSDVFTP